MKSKLRGTFVLSPPEILSVKTSPHKTTRSNLNKNLFITNQTGDKMKTKIKLVSIFSLFCFLSAVFAQDMGISSGPIPTLKQERTNITFQSNARFSHSRLWIFFNNSIHSVCEWSLRI